MRSSVAELVSHSEELPAISPPLPVGLLGSSVMQPTRLNKMADDILIYFALANHPQ